ncbi:MAG TPA: efflux RND transporter periplasmic adaptor subunit [Stellaceae bacterium]|nr:efflux RND transporter periplasmic adaptor subunit [Stellaceae bacterium]
MRHSGSQRTFTIAAAAALLGAGGVLLFLMLGSGVTAQRAPGVVHATEIKIAPEISGRLARFAVTAGQSVRAGDELVELSNPELSAALVLATAQLNEAQAARDRVYAGIRDERVQMLAREIERAKANLTYAEQEYARNSQLVKSADVSRQKLDEAAAKVGTARADLQAAEQAYEAAHSGPTREELAIADSRVEAAAAAESVIAARVAKLRISAPSDGVVALIVAEPGEAIVPGQPVMTLEAAGRRWASFNLREDQLGDLRLGAAVELVPLGGGARIEARVTEMVPRGEFAVWRAARVVGDHDLNTFVLRADTIAASASGLQPGMTVWLEPVGSPGQR